jgi:hypothetical protein
MTVEGGEPNPGSDEAREQGCKCPVLDNNHGKFAPWPPDGWWMNESCPVHRAERAETVAKTERDDR